MTPAETKLNVDRFLQNVRGTVATRLERVSSVLGDAVGSQDLLPGKMLRSRLGGRLTADGGLETAARSTWRTCAAVELVHTASLCHDDVIDNAFLRRARPSLWRTAGRSCAVLIGDLLLCEAMDIVLHTAEGRYAETFLQRVGEVCSAEATQELQLRGSELSEERCMKVARGKTGPLFALVAEVAGGDDEVLCPALSEAGYRMGTAYQLADDLVDVIGEEEEAGKTLGTDRRRNKHTLPQAERGRSRAMKKIREICDGALDCLTAWPGVRRAVARYLLEDLQPVLRRFDPELNAGTGLQDEV
ncbi:MAG: polyprenyl synthetase family protein [Planctomycetota bacterium]